MKKYILFSISLAILSFGLSTSCTNQKKKRNQIKIEQWKENPAQAMIDILTNRKVDLSEEQKVQIKTMADTFDFSGETKYERRIKFKDFREEIAKHILTSEQKNKI